ncbi:hypothetical protein ACQWF7_24625, partial [Salmonella enterica subsp. enterica serovar Infantis]
MKKNVFFFVVFILLFFFFTFGLGGRYLPIGSPIKPQAKAPLSKKQFLVFNIPGLKKKNRRYY